MRADQLTARALAMGLVVCLSVCLGACTARPQYGIVQAQPPKVRLTPTPLPFIPVEIATAMIGDVQNGAQTVSFFTNLPEKTVINLTLRTDAQTSQSTSMVAAGHIALQVPIPKQGVGYIAVTLGYDPAQQEERDAKVWELFGEPFSHTAYLPYPDTNTAMVQAIGAVDRAHGDVLSQYLPMSLDPAAWQFILTAPLSQEECRALADDLRSALNKTDFAPPNNADSAHIVLKVLEDGQEIQCYSDYLGFVPTFAQSKDWVLVDQDGYIHKKKDCYYVDTKISTMLAIVAQSANYHSCKTCFKKEKE